MIATAIRRCLAVAPLVAACACPKPAPDPPPQAPPLQQVTAWACQLQGIELDGAVDRLAQARVDLVVIEPMTTVRGFEDFPIAHVVGQIRASPGASRGDKICLAYVNVGQAERFRTYWGADWHPRNDGGSGNPDFLLASDPDGWEGDFTVAFWEPRWRSILWGSPGALVDRAIDAGFDGVFLDWVLGYSDPVVAAAAEAQGVDPARAMTDLVRDLAAYARERSRGFLVVPLNGAGLPGLAEVVDGVAQEPFTFQGRASQVWDDPENADRLVEYGPGWTTERLLEQLSVFTDAGLPVLTIDYASTPGNVAAAEEASRSRGFVPFVSRTPLDRIPDRLLPGE